MKQFYFFSPGNHIFSGIEQHNDNVALVCFRDSTEGASQSTLALPGCSMGERGSIAGITQTLLEVLSQHQLVCLDNLKSSFYVHDNELLGTAISLNMNVCHPARQVLSLLDNKLSATQFVQSIGVPCIPYKFMELNQYADLEMIKGELSDDVVVQLPLGDCGDTTFFISSESDWQHCRESIVGAGQVKIMKRIQAIGFAIEGCVFDDGVLLGPVLEEVTGISGISPHSSSWCGNQVADQNKYQQQISQITTLSEKITTELIATEYRGHIEIDFLYDIHDQKIYFGEINPRFSGATPVTTAALSTANLRPLVSHHVDYYCQNLMPEVLERQKQDTDLCYTRGVWSQLLLRNYFAKGHIKVSPPGGIWRFEENSIRFISKAENCFAIENACDFYFAKIKCDNDPAPEGCYLGFVMFKGRVFEDLVRLRRICDLLAEAYTMEPA